MTVSTPTSATSYVGTGTTATYAYSWGIAQSTDLIAYTLDATGTVVTKLVNGVDFTVTGAGIPTGGTIVLTAGNLANNVTLFIASDPSQIQALLLQQGASFNPADVMAGLDLLTREVQATRRVANNSIQIPLVESLAGYTMTLPAKGKRASGFVSFDANGNVQIAAGAASTPVTAAMAPVVGAASLALARAAMGPWSDALVTATGTTIARDLQTRLGEFYDVQDFNAKGDGTTDDTTAINAALTAAATAKVGVVFAPGKTYLVSSTITISGSTVPLWLDGQGATLKASGTFGSFPLMKVENPHATVVGFRLQNLTYNGNGQTSKALYVHGCQYGTFANLIATQSGGYGFHIQGEPNFGVYYTTFAHCLAGVTTYTSGNASTGWLIESINNTGGYYVASTLLVQCVSQFNKGHGYSLNYASLTLNCCDAEINDLFGINVDNSVSVDVIGGYTENNDQNRATRGDGTGNGNPDMSVQTTANTTGFRLVGGRHIGGQTGMFLSAGNWWQPGKGTTNPILNSDGTLTLPVAVKGNSTNGLVVTGVSDSTSPVAGQVGEVFESKVTTFQNAAATATWGNLTSIALTPGDWDIEGVAELFCNSATTSGNAQASISTTTASGGTDADNMLIIPAGLASGGMEWPIVFPRMRVQVTTNTTYYLNVLARYSAGTPQWAGKINARRMR